MNLRGQGRHLRRSAVVAWNRRQTERRFDALEYAVTHPRGPYFPKFHWAMTVVRCVGGFAASWDAVIAAHNQADIVAGTFLALSALLWLRAVVVREEYQ